MSRQVHVTIFCCAFFAAIATRSGFAAITYSDPTIVSSASDSTTYPGGSQPYGASGHAAPGINLLTNDYLQIPGTATITADTPTLYGSLTGLADATSASQSNDVYLGANGSTTTVTVTFAKPSDLSVISLETVAALDDRNAYDFDLAYSTNDGASYSNFLTAVSAPALGTGTWITANVDLSDVTNLELVARIPAGNSDGQSTSFSELDITGHAVPEPSSVVALCGLCAMGLFVAVRRAARVSE